MTSHPGDRDDGSGLMEPWTYTDGDNGELVISTCNPGEVTVQTQGNASSIHPALRVARAYLGEAEHA